MARFHFPSRRKFLAGAIATLGTGIFGRSTTALAQEALFPDIDDNDYQPAKEPLQLGKLAGKKGILYGTCVSPRRLPPSPAQWDTSPYGQIIKRQAAIITNANMHFNLIQPTPGRFDFATPDRIMAFAHTNGMQMRGHALCWHEHFPKWMAAMDRNAAIRAMEDHISTVMGHYAGKVHSWDVVNEALNPNDKVPNAMRVSEFTKTIGWDWMGFAFRAARQADPHALLTYNDYRIEVTHYGDSDGRRIGILNLLDDFRRHDIPIDAIGIQSHIDYSAWKYFDAAAYSRFLIEIAARGVKIFLTELDVIDKGSPSDSDQRDQIIADIYRTYLSVALENPAVVMVVNWGLYDQEAWQNHPTYSANPNFRREDGTPGRGLPFDSNMRPKLAAQVIAEVLRSIKKQ
ncbi:Beta-xylanase [Gammaproteobacteria bacterium]